MIIVLISYYRLICWDMLSCPGEVEEHEQRPWQVSLKMLNMVMVNMVSLKMVMMGMVNMVFGWCWRW